MGTEAPSEPAGETKSFCPCWEKAPVGSFLVIFACRRVTLLSSDNRLLPSDIAFGSLPKKVCTCDNPNP